MGTRLHLTIFVIFKASEHYNRKRRAHAGEHEKFRLVNQEMISHQSIKVRPGNVLVPVRNPHELAILKERWKGSIPRSWTLCVDGQAPFGTWSGGFELEPDQIFTDKVAQLFTRLCRLRKKREST